ncbi:MAG TPA: CerR family C-terminal domain-containing protein [Isosphaeraceae bacterium]|jgi:AcrR family transcriptional regulator|nr:CerR family C-terminal domain-containing protein [Isosphaeraceae bacterium]
MAGIDQTKARLLEAAGEEFAEKGFEGATVRSICARAGANLAAVNYHFGDKVQLYLQAILEAHRCGGELPAEEEPVARPPAEQLRQFIHHFLSHHLAMEQSPGWHRKLILHEMLRPTQASDVLANETIRPRFERLLRILARVCPEADERRLHVIGFSIIGQCVHYKMGKHMIERLVGPEECANLDAEYLTDHITAFSLAALGLAPPLDATGESRPEAEAGEAPCVGSR